MLWLFLCIPQIRTCRRELITLIIKACSSITFPVIEKIHTFVYIKLHSFKINITTTGIFSKHMGASTRIWRNNFLHVFFFSSFAPSFPKWSSLGIYGVFFYILRIQLYVYLVIFYWQLCVLLSFFNDVFFYCDLICRCCIFSLCRPYNVEWIRGDAANQKTLLVEWCNFNSSNSIVEIYVKYVILIRFLGLLYFK